MVKICTECSYPDHTCKTCPVVVNYWDSLPCAWRDLYEGIKDVRMTLQGLCKINESALRKMRSGEPAIKTTGLSFEEAFSAAKKGKRITRSDWNGKGQYVFMMPGYESVQANETLSKAAKISPGSDVVIAPYLMLRNSDGIFSNWVPSNGDIFSNEWEIVTTFSIDGTTKPYTGYCRSTSTSTARINPNEQNVTYTGI